MCIALHLLIMCILSSYVVCLSITINTGTCTQKQDLESFRIVELSCIFDPDAEFYTFNGVAPLNGVNIVTFDRFSEASFIEIKKVGNLRTIKISKGESGLCDNILGHSLYVDLYVQDVKCVRCK